MELQSTRSRFAEATWFPRTDESVVVGGAGGIGSWLTFLLARANFNVTLFDDDVIEEHNLSGQLFKASDIGKLKVHAVQNIVGDFSGSYINLYPSKYVAGSVTHRYMFSAFDNMKARRDMFENWKLSIPDSTVVPIFIDGRLEMEQLQIFCVTPANMHIYEKDYLFDDSAVEDLPCSLKQTSHVACMIASHMVAFFTNHMANIYTGEVFREVPFFYEYAVPFSLTTEIR